MPDTPAAAAPIPTVPGYYWAFCDTDDDEPEVVRVDLEGMRDDIPTIYRTGAEFAHDAKDGERHEALRFAPYVTRYVGPLTPPPSDAVDYRALLAKYVRRVMGFVDADFIAERVPSRDFTAAEWAALEVASQAALLSEPSSSDA